MTAKPLTADLSWIELQGAFPISARRPERLSAQDAVGRLPEREPEEGTGESRWDSGRRAVLVRAWNYPRAVRRQTECRQTEAHRFRAAAGLSIPHHEIPPPSSKRSRRGAAGLPAAHERDRSGGRLGAVAGERGAAADRQSPIPYGQKRKREMAAYSQRHYGERTWRLRHPRVIVEHMAQTSTAAAVYNTFAPDVPDPELGELPNVCSHFVVSALGPDLPPRQPPHPLPPHGRPQLDRDRDRARRLRRRRRARRPPPAARLAAADAAGCAAASGSASRRDRPRREPQLSLPPRAGPEPAQPDPRRLAPRARCGSTGRSCGGSGPCRRGIDCAR